MNVKELSQSCGFSVLALPSPDREINGVYIGDLLSWVMGRASEDNAWITIMSNTNVIAVATLTDVSCIILAEGVTLEAEILATAEAKGINVLKSEASAYETARALWSLGL